MRLVEFKKLDLLNQINILVFLNIETFYSRFYNKNLYVNNITYFKKFSECFIWMKFFSMLPYTREETLLYNFECIIRYNLCITSILIFYFLNSNRIFYHSLIYNILYIIFWLNYFICIAKKYWNWYFVLKLWKFIEFKFQ